MSLNMLFRHPELYSTAVSVAPVPDMKLYDTIYQERYMGEALHGTHINMMYVLLMLFCYMRLILPQRHLKKTLRDISMAVPSTSPNT